MNAKYLSIVLLLLLILSCKDDNQKNVENSEVNLVVKDLQSQTFEQTLPFDTIYNHTDADLNKTKSVTMKRNNLLEKEDDKVELQELVSEKKFKKEQDDYLIDFTYPYLNPEVKATYQNFNDFLADNYLNIEGVEADILKENALNCDQLPTNRLKEQRYVDYKIYNLNERIVSVLLYRENYYSGALHPAYTFDCLNYDLDKSVFMDYDDFFNLGSEEEVANIINSVLTEQIQSGDIYYECWEITPDDFVNNKNNFVLDEMKAEFYFDDCVICPSYTGTFSVEIPLTQLMPVLKKYASNPLIL
ncbi:Protein of unknown function [Flavobacteriaceae bacterium MAR_2010_188]|nr:Protein of unknown function [Flavobacteriaceae bacterium MAR_2010_188]